MLFRSEHALDLGLIESPSHLPGLASEVCCEDELVLICAPAHRFAKSAAVTPRQFAGEPYVSRELGSGTREFMDQYLRQCDVAPEDLDVVMELGSPEAIKGVVETGMGIAIVSRATVLRELKLGSLAAVPLEPRLIRAFSLVHPRERFRSKLLTTFAEFATARMKQLANGGA